MYPPAEASCPAVNPRQPVASAAPLGEEFAPVSAAICTFDAVVNPGATAPGGGWRWRTVQRSEGPFGELVAALRTPPPTRRGRELSCPAMAQAPMFIALTDASGRAVIPAIPVDPCGFRLTAVDKAVDRMTWVTVESR
jgi:hypothetical protein